MKSRTTFSEAFLPGINDASSIITNNILQKQERERQEQEKAKLDREQTFILMQLLTNNQSKPAPKIDPKERIKSYNMPEGLSDIRKVGFIISRLTPENKKIFQDMTSQPEVKKQESDYYIDVDYSNPDAIYGFNKRTSKVEKIQDGNPLYKPKRTNTVSDYNANGEKIIREFYEDGTTKDIPTGFYKKHNSTGSGNNGDAFDLNKFNKTINSFTDEEIKINKLKAEYNSLPTDEIKYEINARNESNQATLYDLMDDDSKNIVNEWYTQLKKASEKAGKDYTELERTDQEKLKTKFIETISKNFDGSSEDYARKRALILYAKFKYGYVR